jgi:hypothetical protein
MIVAWHEMPGSLAQAILSRRVRSDSGGDGVDRRRPELHRSVPNHTVPMGLVGLSKKRADLVKE